MHSALKEYDLLVIGGGINGIGIANDAAGRGLSVLLCEQNDLASGTSWKSSKLIHGGLRYLEYYEFQLVHKALREREILLKKAPHIISPLPFVMPYDKQLRPAWVLRLGLFLYDHLSRRKLLPGSYRINFNTHPAGKVLEKKFKTGFIYSDCYVDDSRLVALNAVQAKQLGAQIMPRTQLIAARRSQDGWQATLKNNLSDETTQVKAKILINAAGPWVENVLQQLQIKSNHHTALIKGSHIVIPKFYSNDFAFILQNFDKRIAFVIPFDRDYSLIGTTDIPFNGDLEHINISEEEVQYLCDIINRYFNHHISTKDIVWSFAGVRPLLQDDANNPSAITRDYTLELNTDQAPLLTIFGGKITTYRELSEHALQLLHPYFPHAKEPWTAKNPLPGGDIPNADFNLFYQELLQQYSWLPANLIYRYAKSYGTLIHTLLQNKSKISDLGENFGADLYECEVNYLMQHEWAITAEDILWRRSKLGLQFPKQNIEKLEAFLQQKRL